jgi:hypothetical protein
LHIASPSAVARGHPGITMQGRKRNRLSTQVASAEGRNIHACNIVMYLNYLVFSSKDLLY